MPTLILSVWKPPILHNAPEDKQFGASLPRNEAEGRDSLLMWTKAHGGASDAR